jgi:hypothetical protein
MDSNPSDNIAADSVVDDIVGMDISDVTGNIRSTTAGNINAKLVLEELKKYALISKGNAEIFPSYFESLYLAMKSIQLIGRGNCMNVDSEYENITFMFFNMFTQASGSESVSMTQTVEYLHQFIR